MPQQLQTRSIAGTILALLFGGYCDAQDQIFRASAPWSEMCDTSVSLTWQSLDTTKYIVTEIVPGCHKALFIRYRITQVPCTVIVTSSGTVSMTPGCPTADILSNNPDRETPDDPDIAISRGVAATNRAMETNQEKDAIVAISRAWGNVLASDSPAPLTIGKLINITRVLVSSNSDAGRDLRDWIALLAEMHYPNEADDSYNDTLLTKWISLNHAGDFDSATIQWLSNQLSHNRACSVSIPPLARIAAYEAAARLKHWELAAVLVENPSEIVEGYVTHYRRQRDATLLDSLQNRISNLYTALLAGDRAEEADDVAEYAMTKLPDSRELRIQMIRSASAANVLDGRLLRWLVVDAVSDGHDEAWVTLMLRGGSAKGLKALGIELPK